MVSNNTLILILSELGTFLLSIISAIVIVSIKWGKIQSDVTYMKRDIKELRDTFILTPAARDRASKE